VWTVVVPTSEAVGQLAGFASKTVERQARCSVLRRAGRPVGNPITSPARFAWRVVGFVSLTFTPVPSALVALASVEILTAVLNGRLLQPSTANGLETLAVAPVVE